VESRSAKAAIRVPCDVSIDQSPDVNATKLAKFRRPAIALACAIHRVHDVDDGAGAPERALTCAEPRADVPARFRDKVKNYLSVALGASRGGARRTCPTRFQEPSTARLT
jgi:hypothetical protein